MSAKDFYMGEPVTTQETRNPLDDHLGYQLRRASSLVMTTLAERLSELNLTIVETSVLVLIQANPDIFQSEIGRSLGIKRANMAPLAASLEQRGFIRRKTAEGRQVGLETTRIGSTTAARAEAIMQDNDVKLFAALTADARRELRETLDALWHGASD